MADGARKKKILVIDDSDVVLASVQITLEDAGYQVVLLDNPLVMSAVVRKESPDLILVDVNMPALNGDQLVEIAHRHGTMGSSPVVLHSDMPLPILEERSKRCGASGFIQKTADEAEFVRQVKRWLEP
jgi:CheY-like chemotaxis protein